MDYSDSSEDEFSDIGSGSDVESEDFCETPVCKEHSYIVCRDCMDVVEEDE